MRFFQILKKSLCPELLIGTIRILWRTLIQHQADPGNISGMLSAALNINGMLWKTSPAATELEEVTVKLVKKNARFSQKLLGNNLRYSFNQFDARDCCCKRAVIRIKI